MKTLSTKQASGSILHPHRLTLRSTYSDNDNTLAIQSSIAPTWRSIPPPVTVSLSRRLFRKSLTEGTLSCYIGAQPRLTIAINSPTPFDFTAEASDLDGDFFNNSRPGSISGLGVGARYWSYSITLAGLASHLRAEWGVTFTELALQAKFGLEYGLTGLACVLTGVWRGDTKEIATSVGFGHGGIFLRLEYVFLDFIPV
jgi:DnaJ family protein C protein 11